VIDGSVEKLLPKRSAEGAEGKSIRVIAADQPAYLAVALKRILRN